ncbi:DUF3052 domain-containing protein [Nocardia miyunensis]|uniref:DUF3052 domain-containing protein n=1 Tax=Nocardia miyunensis TaxID=282684 RepID=UPI0008330717|nr:DUF3052 domain-containing protein [Nocardia miyunensis]
MAQQRTNPAAELGIEPGHVVQELGYRDDSGQELRDGIESIIGGKLLDEEFRGVPDIILLWHQTGNGDLTTAVLFATGSLADDGRIWLLTPKAGQAGYVDPVDIDDAARTTGLTRRDSIPVGKDWTGTPLAFPGDGEQ